MSRLHRSAAIPRPIPGAPPVPVVPAPIRFTLPNGLRVLAVSRADLPQVAARLVLPAGSAADPVDSPGTACLAGSLLTEGTQELSALELNERIDNLGASLGARTSHDFAEVDLRLLAETLDQGLELLAAVVATPNFPEREVERVRAESLDALEARLDEPANVADDEVGEAVFGPAHPYGRLPIGTVEGVRRLRRESIVEFHRTRYRPDGSVLVIVGDFEIERLRRRLESAFEGWSGAVDPIEYPPAPVALHTSARSVFVPSEDSTQSELRVAGLGLRRDAPEWITASVANYILGGSTITGRLGANLREDKGWTYGVRSGFSAGVQPGGWVIETAVDAEVTAMALDEIEAEVERMVTERISEEELARASEALILSLPRAFETPGRIVSRLATIEAYGLEPDYWERFPDRVHDVTVDDVASVAAACFAPERLVRVTVGPNNPPGAEP